MILVPMWWQYGGARNGSMVGATYFIKVRHGVVVGSHPVILLNDDNGSDAAGGDAAMWSWW